MIQFTEEHHDIREMVADFSNNELAPKAEHLNESCEFPQQPLAQIGELGLFGAPVPESHGGLGGDLLTSAIIYEELARNCGSTAAVVYAHSTATRTLASFGAAEQKEKWLEGLASGEKLATIATCEAGQSGRMDLTETSATASGSHHSLRGTKLAVIAAKQSDLMLVVAKEFEQLGLYLVEGEASGLSIQPEIKSLGLAGSGLSTVIFEDTPAEKVGAVNPKAGIGDSVEHLIQLCHLGVSSLVIGLARGAHAYALQYASERVAFGRTIDRFEALQLKIAECEAGLASSQLLAYSACTQLTMASTQARRCCSMARFAAVDHCYLSTKEAVQILGGNGYSREYPVERAYRDIMALAGQQGSGDAHRLSLSRDVIGAE